ncbi:hypothetical protein CP8484711_0676A, partial [Chlamydia psittaci 84-8471/1]
MTRCKPLQT